MKIGVVVFPAELRSRLSAYLQGCAGPVCGDDLAQGDVACGAGCDCSARRVFLRRYLRTGAIARFSPVMGAVKEFAKKGGLVLGICNGFQILLEAGLLPGAMLRNKSLHFICKDVSVKVENAATAFTGACQSGQVLKIPIAHETETTTPIR